MAFKNRIFEVFRVSVALEYFVGSLPPWKSPTNWPPPLEKYQCGRPCLLFKIYFYCCETMKVTKVRQLL